MAYTARDGHKFPTAIQHAKYERWLDEQDKAPGGPAHEEAFNKHGMARKVVIEREGNGRTRITSFHNDGHRFTQVHPETYRAHDMARELLGIEPPPAVQTHGRARAHPTGPKEEERIRREDHRDSDNTSESEE